MKDVSLIVYPAADLTAAKRFFRELIGTDPYADSPHYVGYKCGDMEIGLVSSGNTPEAGALAYWTVSDIAATVKALVAAGGTVVQEITDVAYGLVVATVRIPTARPWGYDSRRMAKTTMDNKADKKLEKTPSQLISERIKELGDWRGETLGHVRKLIKEADPGVIEEWKWRGVPVWSHDGGICTGESYKDHVKLTFYKGASLKDPDHLFNASLDGNVRRGIDIHEGEKIDESAFKNLIRAAVKLNSSRTKKR